MNSRTQRESTREDDGLVAKYIGSIPESLRLLVARAILFEEAARRSDSIYFTIDKAGWLAAAATAKRDPLPLLRSIFNQLARERYHVPATPRRPLSQRREQTLQLLLAGCSEKEVAAQMGITRYTVHEHVKRIYRIFAVTTRAELMARLLVTTDLHGCQEPAA